MYCLISFNQANYGASPSLDDCGFTSASTTTAAMHCFSPFLYLSPDILLHTKMPQLWPNKPQSVQNPQSWANKLLASRMPTNPVSPPLTAGALTASTQNTLNSSEDEDLNLKLLMSPPHCRRARALIQLQLFPFPIFHRPRDPPHMPPSFPKILLLQPHTGVVFSPLHLKPVRPCSFASLSPSTNFSTDEPRPRSSTE